jgi:hypothetical protein
VFPPLPTAAWMPYQSTKDIYVGRPYVFTESNSAWHRIDVPKACVLQATDPATVIRFRPENPAQTGDAYGTSRYGVASLRAPGTWYIQIPVQGSVAASRTLFPLDYGLFLDSMELLTTPAQLGASPAAPTVVVVATAASTPILAASATRGRYVLCNTDTANAVYLGFGGNAAVTGSGVMIGPGGSFQVDPADGFASLAVAGQAATADVSVSVQTWD